MTPLAETVEEGDRLISWASAEHLLQIQADDSWSSQRAEDLCRELMNERKYRRCGALLQREDDGL